MSSENSRDWFSWLPEISDVVGDDVDNVGGGVEVVSDLNLKAEIERERARAACERQRFRAWLWRRPLRCVVWGVLAVMAIAFGAGLLSGAIGWREIAFAGFGFAAGESKRRIQHGKHDGRV